MAIPGLFLLISFNWGLSLSQHCEAELSEYGMALKGSAYRSGFSVNLGECGNKCQDDPKCLSITYERDSRICHLNNATKAMLPSVDGASMERQGMSVYATVRLPDCPSTRTTDGACCAFPFMYSGVAYTSCTSVAHGRPWCSKTAVYSSKSWQDCAKQCDNDVKTADRKCCVFPFTYKGVAYTSCTYVNHNRPWCSWTAVYSGGWSNCI
ncbi:cation-independent mannose-6-phosphate receptor isoform X1 [Nematostella vectensis]|uniref:cation-independent mannose-6-phosphate receptor isoform X1 n=1 Tax=Nematostella vectensis TaxID=45351 RepID=UPI001390493A|nr:cation-independent mannose-6-phosphate receptor isoform X1 [Nematostella vectensis]